MKPPFKWDNYSDQPALLTDREFKKSMRKRQSGSLVKMVLTALIVLPLSLILMPFTKRKEIHSEEFFSMGIDFEREPQATLQLIEELGVQRVLLRFKLWEMQNLDSLKEYLLLLKDKKVTLKILQDRENIEDLALLKSNLHTIFSQLNGLVDMYEIGSTINRAKWGFFSVDEYSRFYEVAFLLKKTEFPEIELIGSGVIDFEYHFTAHTLFNFFHYRYDGIASLLYVDRRGAPENMQLGFTLSDKIAWLNTLIWLSPKVKQKLHITEVNWPLTGTAPYAPTSEKECVSEESYANFMLRYHLLAFASQQVDTLSWHQLIATGYGLIDNREGIVKREAFETYKYMYKHLHSAQFLRLDIKREYYILQCLIEEQLLQIHWSLKATTLKNEEYFDAYSKNGEKLKEETLTIGESPLYLFITKASPKKINCI